MCLGRSRGGYGTKACVIADGTGQAIGFALVPGQAHELPLAPDLVGCLPDLPGWIVGDRGYRAVASTCPNHTGNLYVTRQNSSDAEWDNLVTVS
jgi:hypothetical protein